MSKCLSVPKGNGLSNITTIRDKSPIPKNEMSQTNILKSSERINTSYIVNSNNMVNESYFHNFEDDGSSMPLTTKTKIYTWLIDIGIIKDKVINILDLPKICINGVLFCDLINRCEGKNEIIKGIIRKTVNKSQIQVNLNKVLDYLRSREKFSSRHLWSGDEIAKGDKRTIWELLEDLNSYYNKSNFTVKRSSKGKTQRTNSSNMSFIDRKKLLDKSIIDNNLNNATQFSFNDNGNNFNNQPSFMNLSNQNQFIFNKKLILIIRNN